MTRNEKLKHIEYLSRTDEKLRELINATHRIGLFELSNELQFIEGDVSFTLGALKFDIVKTENNS